MLINKAISKSFIGYLITSTKRNSNSIGSCEPNPKSGLFKPIRGDVEPDKYSYYYINKGKYARLYALAIAKLIKLNNILLLGLLQGKM